VLQTTKRRACPAFRFAAAHRPPRRFEAIAEQHVDDRFDQQVVSLE